MRYTHSALPLIALGITLSGCAKEEAPASPGATDAASVSTPEESPGVVTTNPTDMEQMTDNATETVADAMADAPEELVSEVVEEMVEPTKRVEAWSEMFNNIFIDGDFYSAGIPTEEGLRQAAAQGVTLVISLLTDEQHAGMIAFDEAAMLAELGVRFERISVTPQTFSTADVNTFAELMDSVDGPVMSHCGSANRVGAMWAAYLNQHKDVGLAAAIEAGETMGLRSDSLIAAVGRMAAE